MPFQQLPPIGMPLANPANSMLFQLQGAQIQQQAASQALDEQEKLDQAALAQKYALQRSQQRVAEAFAFGQQMAMQQSLQPIGRQLQPQPQQPQLMPPQAQPQAASAQQLQLLQLLLQQQQNPQPPQ